jgi:hypothetical protein
MVYLQNIVDQWVTGRWLKRNAPAVGGGIFDFSIFN